MAPNSFRKTSTKFGSKCFPAPFLIVSTASLNPWASLYTLFDVSASNTSAIATILAERGISWPFSPSGYPEPSHFS